MVHKKDNAIARKHKKQQVTSSPKKTQRAKEQKKRLLRRISTEEAADARRVRANRSLPVDPDRNHEVPTFYQPGGSSQLEQHPNNGSGLSEEDTDCEEDGDAMHAKLNRLPQDERYKAIGKIFALKLWPWVSTGWWIIGTGAGANDQTGPEAKMRDNFRTFLGVEMCMDTVEWMRPQFRQEVLFFSHLDTTSSLYHLAVSKGGTGTQI